MLMDRVSLPRAHDSVNDELASATLAMYWKNQITLAEAEIVSGEHRRSIATQNCILAMERLIPFRRPTEGEPRAGVSGSVVHNVTTSDEDEDRIPYSEESDDDEPMTDFKVPEDTQERGR
jgi:hypothetical protein